MHASVSRIEFEGFHKGLSFEHLLVRKRFIREEKFEFDNLRQVFSVWYVAYKRNANPG